MESTYIGLQIVVLGPLGCNHSTPPLCGALSPQYSLVVLSDDCSAGNGSAAAGGTTAFGSVDDIASALALSLFSERRLDFLTECMVDTL